MKKLKFAKFLCLLTVFVLGGNIAALASSGLIQLNSPKDKSHLVLESKKSVDYQNFEIEELEIEDESEDLDDVPFVNHPIFSIFWAQYFEFKQNSTFADSKGFSLKKVPSWILYRCIRI